MTQPLRMHASYMSQAFGNVQDIVSQMRVALKGVKYDTIVGTGLSGALVIPTIARTLRKKWCIVRKDDNSHSRNKFEGELGQRWIFVDDFVSTGQTRDRVKTVIAEVCEKYEHDTEYVATYQYHYGRLTETPLG